MNVVTTGICARSASDVSSLDAWPRMTPFPARTSGRSARLMMSAARASDGRSGEGRRGRSATSGSPSAGAGLFFLGALERLAHGFGDHRAGLDAGIPLRERPEHIDDVDVLVRFFME